MNFRSKLFFLLTLSLIFLFAGVDGNAQEPNQGGSIKGRLKSPYMRKSIAVVYIERIEGGKFEPPKENPVMDQKDLIFTPHVLPVLVGSSVNFPNNDNVRHNVFSPPKCVHPFNLGSYPAGVEKQVTFDKEGVVPLLCNVHAEMSAYVVVLQNPYFASTDKNGEFIIRNVPPGEHTVTFWHEKLKPVRKKVTVTPQKTVEIQFAKLKRK